MRQYNRQGVILCLSSKPRSLGIKLKTLGLAAIWHMQIEQDEKLPKLKRLI
jgi:hypothetical protein